MIFSKFSLVTLHGAFSTSLLEIHHVEKSTNHTVGKRNAHLRRGYTPMPLTTRPCAAPPNAIESTRIYRKVNL